MKKILLIMICCFFALSSYSQAIMNNSSTESDPYSASLRWTGPPRLDFDIVLLVSDSGYGTDQVVRGDRTTLEVYYLPTDQGINRFEWYLGSWQQYVVGYDNHNGIKNGRLYLRLDNNAPSNQLIEITAFNQYGSNTMGRMMYKLNR